MRLRLLFIVSITFSYYCFGQRTKTAPFQAGFKALHLVDSSRVYKPNTLKTDSLHYRPLDLDIWYPTLETSAATLLFGDLFGLLEERAKQYQDNGDYTGITEELAMFFVAELGLEAESGSTLLNVKTHSYENAQPAKGSLPLIIYMAGFNGMGFENFKILEELAQKGYVVVSIWSMGRYPGNMTNHKLDMLEQVYDAEHAIKALKTQTEWNIDFENIGVLGCSWGSMSAAVLLDRNPEIKAMVSFDGTETHYFGEYEEDDDHLNEIYKAGLLDPEKVTGSYLYLESGNKLSDFQPTGEYHYFKKLNSEKYYLRFENSRHEDFLCIPAILKASERSVNTYETIAESTVQFFQSYLKNETGFDSFYHQLLEKEGITSITYELNPKMPESLVVRGVISDVKSQQKLPYVNIGVLNGEVGTVSDNNGDFELKLDQSLIHDTIRISMVGYKAQTFLVKDLMQQTQGLQIELEEEISELSEVVITARGLKSKTLGNKSQSRFISTGFYYDQLGAETGIRINIRKTPTYVDAFNFHISYNRLSTKALFRLNIYDIANAKPSGSILQKNIVIPVDPEQTGMVSTDLREHDIILEEDAIVTLEWIDNEGEVKKGEGIYFSLGLMTGGTYHRASSQGKMKKFRSMGVGFNLDVRY